MTDPQENVQNEGTPAPSDDRHAGLLDGVFDGGDDEGGAEPEAPEQPQGPNFLDRLNELGFQGVESEEDARERLLQSYRQQQEQIEQLRTQQQQLAQLAQYGNQYLLQQQQAAQPPQQGDSQKWWNPPQVDMQAAQRFRVVGEDGTVRWRPDTPPEIRAQAEAYQAYTEKWAEDLINRPDQVLTPLMEQVFRRMFSEEFQTVQQQQYEQQTVAQIFDQHSGWLYEKDPRTGGMARNADGSPRFTQAGAAALQYVQRAEQIGIRDPAEQMNYAIAMIQSHQRQQQATPQQQRMEHLQRAAQNTPNRTGSMATPEQPLSKPQNSNLSPGRQLLAQLQADGNL